MVVEKAIGIANEFQCDIHLLHNHSPVLPVSFPYEGHVSGYSSNYSNAEAEKKMNMLMEKYGHRMNRGYSMNNAITAGSWFSVMKQYIIAQHIDLVIIPRHTQRFFGEILYNINVNRLTRQTSCPVLTVTNNMNVNQLKNIVVPVSDFLPIRKLTAATYIARQFNSIIHLMGYKKNFHAKELGDAKWLARSYQLLRDHTQLKIHRSSTYGNLVAGNTLSYAKLVEADLIVVNPGKESIPAGWINHLFGRHLYKKSTIPVLTVAPQQ